MKTRNLILVILSAAFAFGGTFTCRSDTTSADFTENPSTPAK
ncbi:MAG: hypothetical protein QOE14_855 [Humisphaera sp.]|nr:hypothetical protein [Humisphaera sp.]